MWKPKIRPRPNLRFAALTAAMLPGLLPAAGALGAAVPPPAEMPAEVAVCGRSSVARHVKVLAVGEQIPQTYSGNRVQNTKGFSWYVSRHFALKTDYKPPKAEFYLRLLEMAYPHYVYLFGAEPPGIEGKRMAVVYASSKTQLGKALASDGIRWNFNGGGITFEGYRCAYNYPSGTLQYHQRYILLHECAHLFQMCLTGTVYNTPGWFFEGLADSLASHVYDQQAGRLTLLVLDKATTNNHFDQGLREYRTQRPAFWDACRQGGSSRGLAFLMANYFLTDPDRWMRFQLYRDEAFGLRGRGPQVREESGKLLTRVFGPPEKLDRDFARWADGQQNTFHYAEWGWEQDAGTLWSYGFAPAGRLSRTDVYLPPGRDDAPSALRMDYPHPPRPALVGPVRRGGQEPAVGAMIDFSRCPTRGVAGIGLGVVDTAPSRPLPAGALFADEAGKTPGLNVAVYEKGLVIDSGEESDNVKNGRLIRRGRAAGFALAAEGTPTAGLSNNYVVEWDGWLKVAPAGRHDFVLTSDDGSWLWVDGKQVVANGGFHEARARTGGVHLAEGMHRIRVRFFQGTGEATVNLALAPKTPPGYLKVLLRDGKELVLDGEELGLGKQETAFGAGFREALAAGGHRAGLSARIAAGALVVTLRAPDPKAGPPRVLTAQLPLPPDARRRLLDNPLTILSRDGWHGVTPYFDNRHIPPAGGWDRPAPIGRWRFAGEPALRALYQAQWLLGDKTPAALTAQKSALLAAMTEPEPRQDRALAAFKASLADLHRAVRKSGAPAETIAKALALLAAGVKK